MTAASKKLSGVDIQRQLRHKNETKMEHNVKLDDQVFVNLPNFGVGKNF
jgi:hypothetical protein